MKNTEIVVQGARAHNLKNIDVTIPRDKIRFMQKVSAAMLNHYLPMHGNF